MLKSVISSFVCKLGTKEFIRTVVTSPYVFKKSDDESNTSVDESKSTLNETVQEKNDKNIEKLEEKPDPLYVCVEKDGPITLIGINSPKNRNAIDELTCSQLCEAFSKFEEDETAKVGVLYGIGGSFSSGSDLCKLSADDLNINILTNPEGSVGPTRRHLKKPVVCGISGYCVANGLELALLCDLRVMEECAILGFFNRRLGVPIVDGGTVRLAKMIGISRALDLILTGRQIKSKEALDMGLVNRIVATGTALGQSVQLASSIAKFPQASLHHDRNAVFSAIYDNTVFDTAIQNEIMTTSKDIMEEMNEGVQKFQKGVGRKGKSTNIKLLSLPAWEIEELAYEEENKIKN